GRRLDELIAPAESFLGLPGQVHRDLDIIGEEAGQLLAVEQERDGGGLRGGAGGLGEFANAPLDDLFGPRKKPPPDAYPQGGDCRSEDGSKQPPFHKRTLPAIRARGARPLTWSSGFIERLSPTTKYSSGPSCCEETDQEQGNLT